MKHTIRAAGFIAVVGGLSLACASPIKTSHDSDPSVDIARFQVYKWISDSPLIGPTAGETAPSHISPIDDQRIRSVVNRELRSRGYRMVPADADADLVVSYNVGTEEKLRVSQTPGRSSVYYGGYGYGAWYGGSQTSVHQYTEGTLSIELWDARTKQAVWVGWASKRLSKNRDESDEVLEEAVTKILEPLPASRS